MKIIVSCSPLSKFECKTHFFSRADKDDNNNVQ